MNYITPTLSVIATAMMTSASFAQAVTWTQDFGQSPYTPNATIVGVRNWIPSQGSSSATDNALIIEAPAVSANALLRLKKTGTENAVRVMNNSFGPITGDVRLTMGLAFEFNPTDHKSTKASVAFTDLSQKTSPFAFGIDFSTTGGLFYMDSSGTQTVILTKSEVKMNAIYTFTLDIDIPNQLVKLVVAGLKADDSAFDYTISGLTTGVFGSLSNPRIDLIYLENNANSNFTAYVDGVSFQPVPEPSTALMLMGTGFATLAFGLRRRNR